MINLTKEILHWEKRAIVYSALLAFGLGLLVIIFELLPDKYFFTFAITIFLIILLELFITTNFYHEKHTTNKKIFYNFKHHNILQVIHHLFFPSLLYWSIVIFIYFNKGIEFYLFFIVLSFVLFLILFENIHSFYKNNISINKSTNYIYDSLSIIFSYLWIDNIFNFGKRNDYSFYISLVIGTCVILFLNFMTLFRHNLSKKSILYSFTGTACYFFIMILANKISVAPIAYALITSIYYYLLSSYIVHDLEHKYDKDIFFEYIVVLILILSLLYMY
ncbi:MAG: hypothetical protein Q9M76_07315 [Candidatus Dojkabacteria bacterium]|nr:hypothetical protein [Candidatus Dojkabacteria bacterium]